MPLNPGIQQSEKSCEERFSLVGQAVASSARTALGALGAREGAIEHEINTVLMENCLHIFEQF